MDLCLLIVAPSSSYYCICIPPFLFELSKLEGWAVRLNSVTGNGCLHRCNWVFKLL